MLEGHLKRLPQKILKKEGAQLNKTIKLGKDIEIMINVYSSLENVLTPISFSYYHKKLKKEYNLLDKYKAKLHRKLQREGQYLDIT